MEERIDKKTFDLHKDLIMDYLNGRIGLKEFEEMHGKIFPQPKDEPRDVKVEKLKELFK